MEDQGLSAARNTGIREATGDFLLFLDADDMLAKGTLRCHLDHFFIKTELDISVGSCLVTPSDEVPQQCIWRPKASHLDLHLCHSNIAPVHAFLTRKSTIRDAGFFDTSLAACEDQDYWLRCASLGKRFGAIGLSPSWQQHDRKQPAAVCLRYCNAL